MKLIYLISRVFLAWNFLNFLDRCVPMGTQVRQKIKILKDFGAAANSLLIQNADRSRIAAGHVNNTSAPHYHLRMCSKALTSLIFRNVANLTLNLKPRNSEFPARKCEETQPDAIYISTPGTTQLQLINFLYNCHVGHSHVCDV